MSSDLPVPKSRFVDLEQSVDAVVNIPVDVRNIIVSYVYDSEEYDKVKDMLEQYSTSVYCLKHAIQNKIQFLYTRYSPGTALHILIPNWNERMEDLMLTFRRLNAVADACDEIVKYSVDYRQDRMVIWFSIMGYKDYFHMLENDYKKAIDNFFT